MNTHEMKRSIQLFERRFLFEITSEALKMTQDNMAPQANPYNNVVQPMGGQKSLQELDENVIFQQTESRTEKINKQQISVTKKNNKIHKLKARKFLLEVIVGYTITMAFMYLNKVVYFPFFEVLMIVIIALSLKSPKKVNLLILLSIPMSIANYNLGVWILTYPEIIICYFSTYAFTQQNYKNLLWIFSTVLFALFGFILIAKVGENSPTAKMVLYYIYPFLLLLIKTAGGLINQFLAQNTLFLLQIPFFLTGLSYGMILTLNQSNVQFWYLLVILTLEIINTRYQFILRLILHLAKIQQWINIAQAQSSGHASIHCYHLVFFVYAVSKLELNSSRFSYNMLQYIDEWYKPLIVWCFFITYETVSILKLRRKENLMIIGYKNNQWSQCVKRGFALSIGLWFFYMGLGIPSNFSPI